MDKPLITKYRPQKLEDIFGNESLKKSLNSVINRKEGLIKTYLLTGPHGCGKTTIARIIANKVGSKNIDFKEFNASNIGGIEFIRMLDKDSRFSSFNKSGKKTFLLDECHELTAKAQEALLKTLEDAPKHCFFILCTTEPQKLKKTLRSRCANYEVSLLNSKKLFDLLKYVVNQEGVENFPDEILHSIAKKVEGSPREALSLLDMIIDLEEDEDCYNIIEQHKMSYDNQNIIDLCQAIIKNNSWSKIASIIKELKEPPETIRIAILNYLGNTLLNKTGKEAERIVIIMDFFVDSFMYQPRGALIHACYSATLK